MRKLVEKDRYSLALIAYIHNNPYKLIDEVQDWSYSSYSSYLDSTERFDFIDYNFGLTGFAGSVQKFKSFHDEMRKAEWNPEDHTVAKSFIGSEEFAKNIIQEHLSLDQIYNEEILGMNFFRNKPFASSSFPVFGLRPAFLT